MGTEDRQIAYRAMIVELSSKLTDKELGSMKFMCKEIIPNRVRDSLATSLHLFEALEERNKLSATNLEFLKHLLKTGCNKREDVLLIVENFERGNVRIVNQCIQQAMDIYTHPMQESGLRDIFQVLEDNLGRDAFHVLRRLGVNDDVLDGLRSDYPRDIKEVIHRALRHWEDSVRHMEPKTKIVEALKKESRNDLVNKIKSL
uniref:Death domain-containing protein n=1 Tax=Biomphalaria glabrata TaxID=6526 RepID=A0A2C9LNN3_BIOGL